MEEEKGNNELRRKREMGLVGLVVSMLDCMAQQSVSLINDEVCGWELTQTPISILTPTPTTNSNNAPFQLGSHADLKN